MFRRYYQEKKYKVNPNDSDIYVPAPYFNENEKMCSGSENLFDNIANKLVNITMQLDTPSAVRLEATVSNNMTDYYDFGEYDVDDYDVDEDYQYFTPEKIKIYNYKSGGNNFDTCEKPYNFKNYNHGQAFVNADGKGNPNHNHTCTWFMRKEKVYKDSDCCKMQSSKKNFQFAAARLLFIFTIICFNYGLQVIFRKMIPDKIGGVVRRRQIESAIKEIINEYVEDYDEALESCEGLLKKFSEKLKKLDSLDLTKDEQIEFRKAHKEQYEIIEKFEDELNLQNSNDNQNDGDSIGDDPIYDTLKRRLSVRRD